MKKRIEIEKIRRKAADSEVYVTKTRRGQEMRIEILTDSDDLNQLEEEDEGGRKLDNYEIAQKYYRLRKLHRDQLLHVAKVYLLSPLLFGQVKYPDKWASFAREAEILPPTGGASVDREISAKDMDTIDDLEASFEIIKRKVEQGDIGNLEILLSAMTRIGKRTKHKAALQTAQQYEFVGKCASDLKTKRSAKNQRSQSYYKTVAVLTLKVVCYVIKMLIKQEKDLVQEFKAACDRDAEDSQSMKEEGNHSFTEGDYSNAIFQYTTALNMDAFNPLLYGNRALCYLKKGEYKAALADGKRCIVVKPDWDKGQHRHAQALFELGHYREAREANDNARKQCSGSKILDEQRAVFYEKMSGESRRSQPPDKPKPTIIPSRSTTSNHSSSTGTDTSSSDRADPYEHMLSRHSPNYYLSSARDMDDGLVLSGYPTYGDPKETLREGEDFPEDLPELVSSEAESGSDEDETDGLGDSSATGGDDKKQQSKTDKEDDEDGEDGESDDSMPELVESSGFEEDDEDNGRSSDSAIPDLVSDESGLSSDDLPLRIQRRTKQPKEIDHDSEEAKREARRMEEEIKRRRIEDNVRKARKKMDREEKKQEETRRMKEVMRAEQKRRSDAEELVLLSPAHLTSQKWHEEADLLRELGRKNTKWDNMREKLVRATRELLDGRSKQASLLYKDALARVTNERSDYGESFTNTDNVVLYYALGVSLLESGGHTDIQDAAINFEKIIKMWTSVPFPLAYYGLGRSFAKQNRFTEALEPLGKGLQIVSARSDWKPLSWPGSPTVIIEESEPDQLKLYFKELVILCTHPPKPDAIDKFPDYTGKREIYFTDPDFKGFVRVVCSDGCRCEYFPANWKKMKANYVDRSTEKDFLMQECLTPDCPGLIELIQVFDHDSKPNAPKKTYQSDTKKEDTKQPRPPPVAVRAPKTSKNKEKKLARLKKDQSETKPSGADSVDDISSVTDDAESLIEVTSASVSESYVEKSEKADTPTEQRIDTELQELPQTENTYVLKKGDDEYLHGKQADKHMRSKKKRTKNVQRLDVLIPQESYSHHRSLPLDHELNSEDLESPFAMPLHLQEQLHAFEAGLDISDMASTAQSVSYSDRASGRTERADGIKRTDAQPPASRSLSVRRDSLEDDPEREQAMKENVWSFFVEILRQEGPLHISDRRMQESYGLLPDEITRYITYHGGLLNFLAESSEIDTAQQRLFLAEDADAVKRSLPEKESLPANFQGFTPNRPPLKLPRKPPVMESLPPTKSKPEKDSKTDVSEEADSGYAAAAIAAASAANEDLASVDVRAALSEDSLSFASSFYPLSKGLDDVEALSVWSHGRRSPSSSLSSSMSSYYGESETARRRDEKLEKERLKEGEMPPGKSEDSGIDAVMSDSFWREKERLMMERSAYGERLESVESSGMLAAVVDEETELERMIDETPLERSRFLPYFDMSRKERSPPPNRDYKAPPTKDQMQKEKNEVKKEERGPKKDVREVNETRKEMKETREGKETRKEMREEKETRKEVREEKRAPRTVGVQTEVRTKNKEAQTSRDLFYGKFDKLERDKARVEKDLRGVNHQLEEAKDRLVQQQKKYQMELEREQKKTSEALDIGKKSVKDEVDDIKGKFDAEMKRSAQEKKDRMEQMRLLKLKIRSLEDEDKKQARARKELELMITQLREECTEEKMKFELEAARFQHREKDLQATARHENKRAERAEIQVLELQREKVITHLELSKRDADVAIMQLSQMLVANPHCAPLVRDALSQWQSYLARLLPVIEEHKVAFDDRIQSVQNGRDMNLLPPVNIAIPMRPTVSINAQLIAQQQAIQMQQHSMQLGERAMLPPAAALAAYPGVPAGGTGVPVAQAAPAAQAAPQPPQPVPVTPDPAPAPSPPVPQAEPPAAEPQTPAVQPQAQSEPQPVQSKPQQAAQRPHKPVSYEKIMKRLWSKFPNCSRSELVDSIRQVRESNNNTLMGLQLEDVVAHATRLIAARNKEKATKAASRTSKRAPVQKPAGTSRKPNRETETEGEDDEMCVICHETMSPSDFVVLECNHKFHLGCIRKWLTEQSTCPTCRVHSLLPDEYPSL